MPDGVTNNALPVRPDDVDLTILGGVEMGTVKLLLLPVLLYEAAEIKNK